MHLAGFNDAFIGKEVSNNYASGSDLTASVNVADNFDVIDINEWQMLTNEQKANLFSLNGLLHVKNGDNFTQPKTFRGNTTSDFSDR